MSNTGQRDSIASAVREDSDWARVRIGDRLQGRLTYEFDGDNIIVRGSAGGSMVIEDGARFLRAGKTLILEQGQGEATVRTALVWSSVVLENEQGQAESNPSIYEPPEVFVPEIGWSDVAFDRVMIEPTPEIFMGAPPPRSALAPGEPEQRPPAPPDPGAWSLGFSAGVIAEGGAGGTVVGQVSGEWVTFAEQLSVVGAAADRLTVDSQGRIRLRPGADFDFSSEPSVDVRIRADWQDQSQEIGGEIPVVHWELNLDNGGVDENASAGTAAGELSGDLVAAGASLRLVGSGAAKFELTGSHELQVADQAGLDHEAADSESVRVEATIHGITQTFTFQVPIADVNEAPFDLALDGNLVEVGNPHDGALIGTLSGADPDAGDSLSYQIIAADPSAALFSVVGDELRVAAGVDLAAIDGHRHDITIRATDSGGLFTDRTFTVYEQFTGTMSPDAQATRAHIEYTPGADTIDLVLAVRYNEWIEVTDDSGLPGVNATLVPDGGGAGTAITLTWDSARTAAEPGINDLYFSVTLDAAQVNAADRVEFADEIISTTGDPLELLTGYNTVIDTDLPALVALYPGAMEPAAIGGLRYEPDNRQTGLRVVLDGESSSELIDDGVTGDGGWGDDPPVLTDGDWIDLRALSAGASVEVSLADARFTYDGLSITDIVRFEGVILGAADDVVDIREQGDLQAVAVETFAIGNDEIHGFEFGADGDVLDFSGLLNRTEADDDVADLVSAAAVTVGGENAVRFTVTSPNDGTTGQLTVFASADSVVQDDLAQLLADGNVVAEGLY